MPKTPPSLADFTDYTIVPATDDQIRQHAQAAHVHWSHGRPFEEFLKAPMREHTRESWGKDGLHEVCARVMLKSRVLVRRDDPQGEIFTGCEVYRRNALVKRPDSDKVEDGIMYAIASVVTPIPHLNRGYATHMLRLLHYQMADPEHMPPSPSTWAALQPCSRDTTTGLEPGVMPKAIGSILWSDVGFEFYEKATIGAKRPGWVVHPDQNVELVWKCLAPAASSTAVDSGSSESEYAWEWIAETDIPAVTRYLSERARERLSATQVDHTIYQCDPASPGVLTWLSVRGPWMSQRKPPADEPFGVQTKNSDGSRTIVLFTGYNDHVGPRLLVTYTDNLRPEHLESLVGKLDVIAHRAGRDEGWIWGLPLDGPIVKAWKALPGREASAGLRGEIKGHLIGAAWYGPEEDAGEFVDWQMWDWC